MSSEQTASAAQDSGLSPSSSALHPSAHSHSQASIHNNNNAALSAGPSHHLFPASPPPNASPQLRVSASTPSMPSLIAQAKTSPVLRAQSRVEDEDDDEREELERKKNENGLLTLTAPLASQSLFTSPAGARAAPARAGPPALLRALSSREKVEEPLNYNRVRIEYAEHVASREMTDAANLIRQALQLRRHFVYRRPQRDTAEFDIRVNPPFKLPSEELPAASRHGFACVNGVFVAWEGDQDDAPPVAQFFSTDLSSPTVPSQQTLAASPASSSSPHSLPASVLLSHADGAAAAASPSSSSPPAAFFTCPSRSDYALALSLIIDIASSGPLRSFAFNRLYLLESRFRLHMTLNADLESVAQRAVPHRDFYNVRKFDNHVHHSGTPQHSPHLAPPHSASLSPCC